MRTKVLSSLAATVLVLSACGGGGGASGDQGKAADLLVSSAEAEGIDVDKGCVEKVADKLSDADAKLIVAAGADGDADLSAAGEALQTELFDCVDMDSLIDQMMDEIGDDPSVDKDCLRGELEDLSRDQLATGDLPDSLFECIDLGG